MRNIQKLILLHFFPRRRHFNMQVLEVIVKQVIIIGVVPVKVSSCYRGGFPLTFHPGLL